MCVNSCSRTSGLPFHNPYRRKREDWNPLAPRQQDDDRRPTARRGPTAAERVLAYLRPHHEVDGGLWTAQDVSAWASWLNSEGILRPGACVAELLGDTSAKDWGGETSDYYTSHLRLHGRRVTAAFLLKGPARFEPMGLNHLGKNNDQIVRLADEPADVLIVQHCHDILPAVRKTLRAFSVQPSRSRRYCLICRSYRGVSPTEKRDCSWPETLSRRFLRSGQEASPY